MGHARPSDILVLQRTAGNRAIQRLIDDRMMNERADIASPSTVVQHHPEVQNDLDIKGDANRIRSGFANHLSRSYPISNGQTTAANSKQGANRDLIGNGVGQNVSLFSVSGKKPGAGELEEIAGRMKHAPDINREQIMRDNDGEGKASREALPKLSYKTIEGPTTHKYGDFKWVVQWILDKASPKGGWIVQKVRSNFDVKDDKNARIDVKAKSGTDPAWWPLWEAWPVNKGEKVTTYASEDSDPVDDTYGSPGFGAKTKGAREVLGDAEFYEGLKLPSSFKATNKAPAWILPSTQSDPGLTGGSGSLTHNLKATWDGVDGDGETKATTS